MEARSAQAPAKLIVEGPAVVSAKTKRLLGRDLSDAIAVLDHKDLDETAAEGLLASRVKAVVNASPTMSGAYPTKGSLLLLRERIPICEVAAHDFHLFHDGCRVQIYEDRIRTGRFDIMYRALDETRWLSLYRSALQRMDELLSQFIDNTLAYAQREKGLVLHPLPLPPLRTQLERRHALVVARGSGCREDLAAIAPYIAEWRPVAIGVDGGADALLEAGYAPQLIVGDMDSVSDDALRCGAELIVHAYLDGTAPGLARIRALGLDAHVVPAVGTSEDVAMLVAHQAQADLIVALGTRMHMIDFLEKGRNGMGSTLLTRMKIGGKLIDAKGIQTFYKRSEGAAYAYDRFHSYSRLE